jgi:hypothetical protein
MGRRQSSRTSFCGGTIVQIDVREENVVVQEEQLFT